MRYFRIIATAVNMNHSSADDSKTDS